MQNTSEMKGFAKIINSFTQVKESSFSDRYKKFFQVSTGIIFFICKIVYFWVSKRNFFFDWKISFFRYRSVINFLIQKLVFWG